VREFLQTIYDVMMYDWFKYPCILSIYLIVLISIFTNTGNKNKLFIGTVMWFSLSIIIVMYSICLFLLQEFIPFTY